MWACAEIEDEVVDLAGRQRVSPRGHQRGEAHAGAAAPDRVGELGIALLLLEFRVREVARTWIQVEGVEAVAGARLAVARLAVVRERDLAEAGLVRERLGGVGGGHFGSRCGGCRRGRCGGCLRGGRLRCHGRRRLPGAGNRHEQEDERDKRRNPESHLAPRAALGTSRRARRTAASRGRRSAAARRCRSGRSSGQRTSARQR